MKITDRHGGVDDVGNDEHNIADFFLQFGFQSFAFGQTLGKLRHFGFFRLGFLTLALRHQRADALGNLVAVGAKTVGLLHDGAQFLVERNDFIDERELGVLKFLADIVLDDIGVFPKESDVQHK